MFPRTLVIVGLLGVQLAVTVTLAMRDAPTPRGSTVTWTFVPVPVASPPVESPRPATPPPPPLATTRPSCPPLRTDAAALPTGQALPHGANRVTASMTNAGWLAAWDEERVLVSTDGGRSFAQVLDGPGTVRDVTFDCYGRPIVMRGARVGIRDNGREVWRAIPGAAADAPAALIGGGPDVVALSVENKEVWRARVAISSDLGASWWYRDLHDYWEESRASGHQDGDGTIHIAITTADCMDDPSIWLRIHPDGRVDSDDLGDVGRVALFDDYIIGGGGYGPLKWKHFGENRWHEIKGISGPAELASGPLPRAVSANALYTIDHGRANPLRPWTFGDATVDRAGRLWGIDETREGEDAWLVGVPGTRAPIPPPPPDNE